MLAERVRIKKEGLERERARCRADFSFSNPGTIANQTKGKGRMLRVTNLIKYRRGTTLIAFNDTPKFSLEETRSRGKVVKKGMENFGGGKRAVRHCLH